MKDLDEILKLYERLKEYSAKINDKEIDEIVRGFENAFSSYMKETNMKKRHITPEYMRRLMYKEQVDTNPEFVERRLKERKLQLYKAASRVLPENTAKKLADRAFWWVED